MMRRMYSLLIIIAGFSFMLLSSSIAEEEKYYYAFEEKVPLIAKENTLLVKFTDDVDKTKVGELIKTGISSGYKEKWHNTQTVEITVNSEKTTNALRAKLESSNEVYTCQPFYTLKDGLDMGVSDEVLIRFLPLISEEQKEKLFKSFEVGLVKTTKIYQKLKVKKGADALETANRIYESGLVEFSTPSFISYVEFDQIIPNDTYFNRQITCHNTGQIFTDGHSGTADADIDAPIAWGITTGCSDIIVAVIDQGVTTNHPDLPNSRQVRLNGSNFGAGDANDPSPTDNDNHGNACAGVIAATMNNNQGIAGIAPECKIMPIRTDNSTTPPDIADAIEFAADNGADILSNSWSYPSSDQNLYPEIVTAINYALSNDCIVIFSAGNTANHAGSNNGYVRFPANVNISGVITVGASDRHDNQANYSPTSSLIDIVAPSHRAYPCNISGETLEMWSIDIPGDAGYNSWHSTGACNNPPAVGEILPDNGTNFQSYTARFGGTSHSCPVVAGVAALILSVNPDLSYMDVFNILTSTADKVGGYTYSSGKCNEMGYGRVNAHAALLETIDQMNISISGNTIICSSNAYSVSNLPSGSVEWSLSPHPSPIQLQEDIPGTNQCLVSNPYRYPAVMILTAEITTDCGAHITITKTIASDTNTSYQAGSYSQQACYAYNNSFPSQSGTLNGSSIFLYPGCMAEFSLSQMTGREVALAPSSGQPLFWTYQSSNSKLYVQLPNQSGGIPFTFYITGDGACYSLKTLTLFAYSGYSLLLSPNPTTGEATVTIEQSTTEDGTLKSASPDNIFDKNAEWDIEVYDNAQSLKLKKQKLKGKSTTIQTASWKEGVYMVRVKYKDEILTGKLVVKK
nr:S8 family peptidase [uncultured Draconibacterium sp.]